MIHTINGKLETISCGMTFGSFSFSIADKIDFRYVAFNRFEGMLDMLTNGGKSRNRKVPLDVRIENLLCEDDIRSHANSPYVSYKEGRGLIGGPIKFKLFNFKSPVLSNEGLIKFDMVVVEVDPEAKTAAVAIDYSEAN